MQDQMPKIHSTNYYNTLILVAEDTKATEAIVPPSKEGKPTIANMHFDMLHEHPYQFSSDDLLFITYAERQGIPEQEQEMARELFFSKGQACMRTSALAKNYGWGIHANEAGKIALVAMESPTYNALTDDPGTKKIKAMKRSK